MVAESFAVIIIVAAICFIYIRARRIPYVVAVIPLALVPGVHLLVQALDRPISKILPLSQLEIAAGADLLAALLACLCFGIFSTRFTDVINRRVYLITCTAFTVIYTVALLRGMGVFSV